MKEKELNKLLLVGCIFSFLFFLSSFLFEKDGKVSQKSSEASILNPKYKDSVKKIVLSRDGSELSLTNYGDVWIEEQGGLCAIADRELAESVIERLIKIRKMYKISDDYKKNVSYNQDYITPFSVSFFDSEEKLISDALFFSSDSLTGRMAFASSKTGNLYESEDDFFHLLNTDMNFWAEGDIFFCISDPVLITYTDKSGANKTHIIEESSKNFKNASYELQRLRHGQISKNPPKNTEPILEITVQDGNGRSVRARVFSSDGDFFVSRTLIASELFDTPESSFGFLLENASYEISGWTFDRIKTALGM